MKILDSLKTAALFLIAAGLFVMSYVFYDVMGKHGRYVPVSDDDELVVVMDTHTGEVWSVNYETRQTASLKIFNPIAGELQIFPKKLSARVGKWICESEGVEKDAWKLTEKEKAVNPFWDKKEVAR